MSVDEMEKPVGVSETDAEAGGEAAAGEAEYTERGLRELVDQSIIDVESDEKQIFAKADRGVEPPASLGLEVGRASDIFEKEGFAQQVQAMKGKISALVSATKEKLAKLIGGKQGEGQGQRTKPEIPAEVPIADNTVALEAIVEESPSVAAEEEKTAAPEAKETPDQREKRERKEYLEKEVFPKLGLTKEDEERTIAEAPVEKREVAEHSFANVRATVEAFMKSYSELGIVDDRALQEDRVRAEKEAFREIVPKYRAAFNFELSDSDLETMFDDKDGFRKFEQLIYEQYRAAGTWDDDHYNTNIALHNEWGKDFNNRTQDLSVFRRKLPREELVEALHKEFDSVENNHAITINIGWESLMATLREGEFKTVAQLTPEQIETLRRKSYREISSFYLDQRKKTEDLLGFKENDRVVYGALANSGGDEGRRGGAPTYGDIFLEMEDDPGITYTEGDSYNMNASPTQNEKDFDYRPDFKGIKRQAYGKTALISKAVDNVEGSVSERLTGTRAGLVYIEAQIPNPTLDRIKRIRVPKKFETTILAGLTELSDGDKWKEKISIIEE